MEPASNKPIVVLVDRSPESSDALTWAIAQARRADEQLMIVAPYDCNTLPVSGSTVTYLRELEHAELLATELLRSITEETPELGAVDFRTQVIEGPLESAARRFASHASLLVLPCPQPGRGVLGRLRRSPVARLVGRVESPVVLVGSPVGEPVSV